MRTKNLLAGIIRAAMLMVIALVAVSGIASAGAPVISNVTSSIVTSNSATITWDTDVLSDSQVKYNTTSGNYSYKYNATNVTSHNISLTELSENTTYYYVVNSTNVSGNSTESLEYNFTTLEPVDEVEVIPATIVIKPETLNLKSKGVFVAFIQLPEGYDVAKIDVSTVKCEGAEAVKGVVSRNKYIAKFNRQDLVGVELGDADTLTVTGEFDGTPFEGSDTISVKLQAHNLMHVSKGTANDKPKKMR